MCLYIQTDRFYLVDVGFGDLFIRPLEIRDGIQTDGRGSFRIEPFASGQYLLSTITPDGATERKYTFSLQEEPAEVFQALCCDKQTNPESYFVKNTICTKATPTGRITIFNDKLIERYGDERMVVAIENDLVLRQVLEKRFEITI
jgi:N-hydroxyarylamine O-acetyltransferase